MATTAAVPSVAGSSEYATIEAAPDPLLEYKYSNCSTPRGSRPVGLASASPTSSRPRPSSPYPPRLPPRKPVALQAVNSTGALTGKMRFPLRIEHSPLHPLQTPDHPGTSPVMLPLLRGAALNSDVVPRWMCCRGCSTLIFAPRETQQ